MARKHIKLSGSRVVDQNTLRYLQEHPGRPAIPPIKISHLQGTVYEDLGVVPKETMIQIIKMNKENMMAEYMKPHIAISMDSIAHRWVTQHEEFTERFQPGEIVRSVKQITDDDPDEKIRIKADDPDLISYITIRADGNKCDERQIWYTAFDKSSWVAMMYVVGVNIKERSIFPVNVSQIYMGKKERNAESVLRKNWSGNKYGTRLVSDYKEQENLAYYDWHTLEVINEILKWFLRCPASCKVSVDDPSYSDLEMYFFERVRRELSGTAVQTFFVYSAVGAEWKNESDKIYQEINEKIISGGRGDLGFDDVGEIPLIDFTEKEKKFISKYIDDLNYFKKEETVEVDMVEKLSHPRYGYNFRIPVARDSGKVETFIMSYILDEDKDLMRVYAFYTDEEDVQSVMMVDFKDIRHFTGMSNFVSIRAGIITPSDRELYNDKHVMKSHMADAFLSFEDSMILIYELFSIHIVIYDRPQRTRMVRCQEIDTNPSPKKKSSGSTEPEYIVRRILKPVKEAKELVRLSQNTTPGSPVQREYTMEEWERIGHWRRLPGSEEMIWIEKTTCRRQLPLSDKEIHIKL